MTPPPPPPEGASYWREQLEETATLVASMLRTCAFCGHPSDFHNPVRICVVCRVPSCRDCRLSLSIHDDQTTHEVIQSCRHAPRRAR